MHWLKEVKKDNGIEILHNLTSFIFVHPQYPKSHLTNRCSCIVSSTYLAESQAFFHGLVGGRWFPTGFGPDGDLWSFFMSSQLGTWCLVDSVELDCKDPSLKWTDLVAWTLPSVLVHRKATKRNHAKRRRMSLCLLAISSWVMVSLEWMSLGDARGLSLNTYLVIITQLEIVKMLQWLSGNPMPLHAEAWNERVINPDFTSLWVDFFLEMIAYMIVNCLLVGFSLISFKKAFWRPKQCWWPGILGPTECLHRYFQVW